MHVNALFILRFQSLDRTFNPADISKLAKELF